MKEVGNDILFMAKVLGTLKPKVMMIILLSILKLSDLQVSIPLEKQSYSVFKIF